MENTKSYRGKCHCGLFQFTLNIAPLNTLWTCNCSICSRNGYLWIHPVQEAQLVIDVGQEKKLHAYEFAKRGTTHLFCPECGSSVMARRRGAAPNESLRINARMLEDVDLDNIAVRPFGEKEGSKGESDLRAGSREAIQAENKFRTEMDTIKRNESTIITYKGNCHCKKFRFEFELPEVEKLGSCDCSICARNAYLSLAPFHGIPASALTILSNTTALKIYTFGQRIMNHCFCPDCGISVYAHRLATNEIYINARALHPPLPLRTLPTSVFPGSHTPPTRSPLLPASVPKMSLSAADEAEGRKVYVGSCHCRAVRYSVRTKALVGEGAQKVMCCNCSLCLRNGDLWIYPPKSDVLVEGAENLVAYAFLSPLSLHCFCGGCGGSVLVRAEDDDVCPINVRTMEGVDLAKLEMMYYDGWANGEEYVVD